MTRHARHLARMRRARWDRRPGWLRGLIVGVDMAYGKDKTVTLVYRDGKWRPA